MNPPPSPTRRSIGITAAILILAVCGSTGCVSTHESIQSTGTYSFTPERFSSIDLVTTAGRESIKAVTSTKEENSERTIFASKLAPVGASPNSYTTPKGTLFTLTQLPKRVVNDTNRSINSGDWKLTITGKGAEYNRLKGEMPPVAFGDKTPLVYSGTKDQ